MTPLESSDALLVLGGRPRRSSPTCATSARQTSLKDWKPGCEWPRRRLRSTAAYGGHSATDRLRRGCTLLTPLATSRPLHMGIPLCPSTTLATFPPIHHCEPAGYTSSSTRCPC